MSALHALTGMLLTATLAAGAPPASTQPGATPRKDRRSTAYDQYRQELAFNQATLRGAYDRIGKRDAKWDRQAGEFLDLMAQYFSMPSVSVHYLPPDFAAVKPKALELGKAAMDAGCEDPLVMYCYAAVLQDSQRAAEAEPLLYKSFDGMLAGDYPASRLWAAAARTERTAAAAPDGKRNLLMIRAHGIETDARVRAACGKLDDGGRRNLYHLLIQELESAPRAEQVAFIEQLAERKDADPWLRDSLDGYVHTQIAWDKRGGGWANTVTEEGWKGFYLNLRIARDRLTAAWKLAPQLPEPASDMITVAMGGGRDLGESVMVWFERATDAQVDYAPAYMLTYNALLPRWGGSYEQILELGRACIAYGRYDTLVPWQYAIAVEVIRNDGPAGAQILKDPKVYEPLAQVADAYASERKDKGDGGWYKTYHAAAAWSTGRLAEARKALEDAGDSAEPQAFEIFGGSDLPETISGIYAMTGPDAAVVRAADSDIAHGDAPAALARYRQLLARLDKSDRTRPFFVMKAREVDERIKMLAGEWVDIQPGFHEKDWKQMEGSWRRDGDQLISIQGRRPAPASTIWARVPGHVTPLEVAGHIEFLPHDPKRGPSQGGVTLFTESVKQRGFVVLGEDRRAGLAGFGAQDRFVPADVPSSCDFLVRYTRDAVVIEINGKPVGEPFPLPAPYKEGVVLAVGSPNGAPLRFTKLRMRYLIPKPAASTQPVSKPPSDKP